MAARVQRLQVPVGRDLLVAAAIAAVTALLAFAGVHKLGTAGLFAPLILVIAVALLSRPTVTVPLVVALAVLCEGETFGIFNFTSELYVQIYKDTSLLDVLVALAVASVAIDLLRNRRPFYCPRPLIVPLAILALAMIVGVVVGHAAGGSLRFVITSEYTLAYLLFLPLAVVNLDLDQRQMTRLLGGAMALAIVKSVVGLVEFASHAGPMVEGVSGLTYYEPTANWLILIALLSLVVAGVTRVKPPLWMILGSPLLASCLLLSYRRSFWIAAVLGLLLILLLGTTTLGRRQLAAAGLAVIAGIWLLGSVHFQSQSPLAKRVTSLAPTKIEASAEDSYRLDERANVLSEIREHPITGLGMTIPWAATARTLSLESGGELREYVHFAALWFWLKLGVLGLCAYIGFILGSLLLAWQVWRRRQEPLLRAFGLASFCGIAGLAVMDTTASFTGVESRFTVLLAAQVGLLALLARTASVPMSTRLRGTPDDEGDRLVSLQG
jgi:O-Antigen ligase